ncbi:MAG: hypothetical protein Q8L48_17870 [Archangium sp.]|nr:hypothetical protein [Archangium sp.]
MRFEPGGGGAVIGNDKPTDPPSLSLPLYCWVVKGGFWEDGFSGMEDGTKWGGRRAVNHFHDPLATGGGGYTGLLDENALESTPMLNLVRRGISVTEWVMNAQSGGADGKNHWGYPTIGEGLHRAFSERELAKRESGLASAFRAMGQVMHLISDNTVPDHARDLAHPGDGFEEWLRDDARFKKLFGHTPAATWTIFPVRTLATDGIRAFWDRDVYSTSPAATLSGLTPGIAEFTNANFLAWSHLKRGPADIDFSTVPKNTGEGFKRSPRLGSLAPTLAFLPLPRIDNLVEYPWPQLDSRAGNLFPSAPGSLPLPAVAVFDSAWSDGFSGPNVLGPDAWNHYAEPLMARAHGYAQSVLSLGLQPARAEVTPSASGDMLRLSVRLWNLWPASSPHALTWSVTQLELVSIKPDDVMAPNGARVELLTTVFQDVAPGGVLEASVGVSFAQYSTLARSSHSALLVTAHLQNPERTPLKFAVPIPNGFPLVKQLETIDQTTLFVAPVEACCTTNTCNKCGAQQAFRNPISQRLTGEIEIIPTERDIFMKKAPKEVKEAMKRDARVSGVALLAWNQPDATFAAPTRTMNATSLVLENSNLERVNNGFWLRNQAAPDVADGTLRFTVSLDPRDFYVASTSPIVDGARATGTVYLAVWMTTGALYLHRLIFWPMGPNQAVAQVVGAAATCSLDGAPRLELPEERTSVCTSSETSNNPCAGQERTQRLSITAADNGLARVQWAVSEALTIQAMLTFGLVRPTRFGDLDLPATADNRFAAPCTQAQLAIFPSGNGRMACNGWASGLGYFNVENTAQAPGLCAQVAPPLAVPRTVAYVHAFFEEPELFTEVFGLETLPMPPTFELTSL